MDERGTTDDERLPVAPTSSPEPMPSWPAPAGPPVDPSRPAPYDGGPGHPAVEPTPPAHPGYPGPGDAVAGPGFAPPWPPAPYGAPPPVSVPPDPRRRARRRWLVVALVGLVLAASGAVVTIVTVREVDTPQATVRAYFDALAGGDAGAALALGDLPEGGRGLLTAAVLRATLRTAPIDDVRVDDPVTGADSTTVAVRYRLGGASAQDVDDVVTLRRVDGRWRLAQAAVPVSISVADAAGWAAVTAPDPFALPTGTQLVFPGAAPVTFRTPLLEVAPATRVVRLRGDDDTARGSAVASLEIGAQVSADGRQTVTTTVAAALTACARGGSDVDPYCPQPAPGRADGVALRSVPQSFTGSLRDLDNLDLDLDVASDGNGSITVSGSVPATGRWQVLDYDNVAQQRKGSATLTFGGTVGVAEPSQLAWDRV